MTLPPPHPPPEKIPFYATAMYVKNVKHWWQTGLTKQKNNFAVKLPYTNKMNWSAEISITLLSKKLPLWPVVTCPVGCCVALEACDISPYITITCRIVLSIIQLHIVGCNIWWVIVLPWSSFYLYTAGTRLVKNVKFWMIDMYNFVAYARQFCVASSSSLC